MRSFVCAMILLLGPAYCSWADYGLSAWIVDFYYCGLIAYGSCTEPGLVALKMVWQVWWRHTKFKRGESW